MAETTESGFSGNLPNAEANPTDRPRVRVARRRREKPALSLKGDDCRVFAEVGQQAAGACKILVECCAGRCRRIGLVCPKPPA